ncbi:DrmB family protein [Tundrisphaera sp. TA3]|uniref:DrmB family protein n=1 Tax=Tundrisphaera sp. TA3 TaxID=3435775 RepID=UPI003EBE875F
MSTSPRKVKVGEIRPSQVLTTFGVGSMIDLPFLSVILMGLEDWPVAQSIKVNEERLLASVQEVLGPRVEALRTPPRPPSDGATPGPLDEASTMGIPVAPFPRWMVCPKCRLLAPIPPASDLLKLVPHLQYPDRTQYVHSNCHIPGKTPAVPARFLVACHKGHLDDFPWDWYVHRGQPGCQSTLRLFEIGTSGEAADVEVRCDTCKSRRRMAEAFGRDNQTNLPRCNRRRPHLRDYDPADCGVEHMSTILQGASNSWFSIFLSALSIPEATDKLAQLVAENWTNLKAVQSRQNVELLRGVGMLREFASYDDERVWRAIEEKRSEGESPPSVGPSDLKSPEYAIFTEPNTSRNTPDFKLKVVPPPGRYAKYLEKVVLVERLREVRALVGFTRIGSPGDYEDPVEIPDDIRAPLSRKAPRWVPASEIRGEGIFLHFREDLIEEWSGRMARHDHDFFEAHKRWRTARGLPEPEKGYPGLRFVLLHSLAHALIRQLSLECGYTAASLRERIYSRIPALGEPMAGFLIYTAAPDSEGTLGGLVSLGDPETLGRHLDHALEIVRLCSSDPLCAEHRPTQGSLTLHGAACHACLFVPETSCERGNKYLDRTVLVETVERDDLAFFEDEA